VEGSIQSGFDHWTKYGEKEGRTPSCKGWLKANTEQLSRSKAKDGGTKGADIGTEDKRV
jgi:hypothetical protein